MTSFTFNQAMDKFRTLPVEWQSRVLELIRVLTELPVQGEPTENKVMVKGTYQNGAIELPESIDARDGQEVIVTFLEAPTEIENSLGDEAYEKGWDELEQLIHDCQISTGITDLAAQHRHYRLGTPKREL